MGYFENQLLVFKVLHYKFKLEVGMQSKNAIATVHVMAVQYVHDTQILGGHEMTPSTKTQGYNTSEVTACVAAALKR